MTEIVAVLFDTETTGLLKPKVSDIHLQPQVIEYYGMKVVHRADGVIEKIDEFETYLKPEKEFNEKDWTIVVKNIKPEIKKLEEEIKNEED